MNKGITKSFAIFLLPMLLSLAAWSQEITVTGKVTDFKDGAPLIGVNIVVKGTTIGVATDFDGYYTITTAANSTLVFSYIGYDNIEEEVAGRKTINVQLIEAFESLEEIVVIGYGTVEKKDLTGSVTTVSSKDFNRGAITTTQELLVGKSAGVVITSNSGAPGSGATIRIRGGSSLYASNDPLVIVDGVPLDNTNVSGSSNFLSFVNPNDIESITILKDASSTAIYGSRASNGVMIITTKSGREGTPLRVSYNVNTSISSAVKLMDVYSGDQLRQIAYENQDLYGSSNLHLLGSENTNWQNELFRNAFSQDHNLNFTGAYKTLPYRVSVGYTNEDGIMKNTGMERITGAVNLTPSFFDKSLKMSVNVKGMTTDNNFGDHGALGSAISMDPTQPIYDGNESSNGYFQWENYGANLGTPNPVEQLMAADNKSVVNRFIGNIQLDYQLPFIEGMSANLNVATDYTESEGHNNRPTTSPSVLISPLDWGKLSDYKETNTNQLFDFYLNYTKDLEDIDSKVEAMAGYSWQRFEREGNSYTRGIEDELHPYQKSDSSSFITENYLVSFFGRVNYTLKDKYLVTVTLRNDGSSRFADGNRWGLFPSAAVAWKINNEPFMQGISSLTDLKLRASWGITGQQDIGNDYAAQAQYIASVEGSYYPINGVFLPTLRPNAYDPNIKWEETTTQNIGLDFGFFNNRISGSVDVYKRVTEDLLNTIDIPSGSNFSNTLLTNVGSLENKGIEAALNLIPISQRDMNLTVGFNFTYNENKITKLLMSDDPDFIGILYGDAFTGFNQVTRVGYPAYAFFVNQQVYYANGYPVEGVYVDLSGEGGVVSGDNADKYIYKSPSPEYIIGFNFRYSYKNFDLSASTRANIGNYVYNGVAASASYDQMQQIGYWKNFTTQLSDTKFVKRQFTSDYFVENASFFKIDYISAGYNFGNLLNTFDLRLNLSVQNVLTVTKYTGMDPEVDGGIDNSFYPRPRTILLGLNFTF